MKLPALFAAALLAMPLVSPAASPAPSVPIDQALKLAMDHLAGRGLTGAHYISSVTLEDSAITGGQRYWFVRWVPSIKTDDKTSESGLQIAMDGTLSRVVSGGPNGTGRPDNPGQRRVGSRSIR